MSSSAVASTGTLSEGLPVCVRCKKSITSGHAYELGDDKWHTHCFSCYRCEKPLSCDSDFLVLGTGALICFDCSDSCKNCGKKIDDLAIILSSSNEAYCSSCFKCCKCGENITDLRYAKTKRGLFCLKCHEKLLAKRKHYEQKKRLHKDLPTIPPPVPNISEEEEEEEMEEKSAQSRSRESNTPNLIIPARSANRPISPSRSGNSHSRSNSRSFSNVSTLIKSTSESVVAQYLNKSDDDEQNTDTNENDAIGEESKLEENRPQHSRNVSIDFVLNSTLEHGDEEDEEDGTDNVVLEIPSSNKDLLSRTPLRNTLNDKTFKSPSSYRRGMILRDDDGDDNSLDDGTNTKQSIEAMYIDPHDLEPKQLDLLEAPISLAPPTEPKHGLALNFASPLLEKLEKQSTQIFEHHQTTTTPSHHLISPTSTPHSASISVRTENSKNDNIVTPQSSKQNHTSHGILGRSLSMKSKNLVHNLKAKTIGNKQESKSLSTPSSENNKSSSNQIPTPDTHSGWGVSSFSKASFTNNNSTSYILKG